MMSEVSGTMSDSQFSALTSVSLSDTDFFMKFFEKSFLLQHIQCRDQISIAGTAGIPLSDKEDCVIVGRCANHILLDRTSVFIYAPFETRVKTIMERLDREEKSARKLVKRMDKERKAYYEFFTDENWLDMGQYDLCIDSSRFTTEEIVKILKEAYER